MARGEFTRPFITFALLINTHTSTHTPSIQYNNLFLMCCLSEYLVGNLIADFGAEVALEIADEQLQFAINLVFI